MIGIIMTGGIKINLSPQHNEGCIGFSADDADYRVFFAAVGIAARGKSIAADVFMYLVFANIFILRI
jgi:hypothetical protein